MFCLLSHSPPPHESEDHLLGSAHSYQNPVAVGISEADDQPDYDYVSHSAASNKAEPLIELAECPAYSSAPRDHN